MALHALHLRAEEHPRRDRRRRHRLVVEVRDRKFAAGSASIEPSAPDERGDRPLQGRSAANDLPQEREERPAVPDIGAPPGRRASSSRPSRNADRNRGCRAAGRSPRGACSAPCPRETPRPPPPRGSALRDRARSVVAIRRRSRRGWVRRPWRRQPCSIRSSTNATMSAGGVTASTGRGAFDRGVGFRPHRRPVADRDGPVVRRAAGHPPRRIPEPRPRPPTRRRLVRSLAATSRKPERRRRTPPRRASTSTRGGPDRGPRPASRRPPQPAGRRCRPRRVLVGRRRFISRAASQSKVPCRCR